MSYIKTLDFEEARIYDSCQHITKRDSQTVTFESNSNGQDTTTVLFKPFTIPESATFLLFDIQTEFLYPQDARLGNVTVIIQPLQGDPVKQVIRGSFQGTLVLDLSTVNGEAEWLGIHFVGGMFNPGEFTATVSNLRVLDNAILPEMVDFQKAEKSDPGHNITKIDSQSVKFISNESDTCEILFEPFTIPESASFVLFDIVTEFIYPQDPRGGNVNVTIQPIQGDPLIQIVQGQYHGTLGLDLSTINGEVKWLGINFSIGSFNYREFIVTVSNLRFLDNHGLCSTTQPTPSAPFSIRIENIE